MSKIRVEFSLKNHTTLEEYTYKGIGLLNQDKIIFQEDGIMVTILKKKSRIEMRRNHKEYTMQINLEEQKTCMGSYDIFGLAQFTLKARTHSLTIKEEHILGVYDMFLNEEPVGHFELKLTYEVIE